MLTRSRPRVRMCFCFCRHSCVRVCASVSVGPLPFFACVVSYHHGACVPLGCGLDASQSCSDDFTTRMWDWETGWSLARTFDGHEHFVMMLCFSPKDPSTFATASLDGTIKVWQCGYSFWPCFSMFSLLLLSTVLKRSGDHGDRGFLALDRWQPIVGISHAHTRTNMYIYTHTHTLSLSDHPSQVWGINNNKCHFTLVGHEKSVNCIEYYHGGDKPYLISGSDDRWVAWTRSL